jgi:hypothetical protein
VSGQFRCQALEVRAADADRHQSCAFIGFSSGSTPLIPMDTAIKLILDNHFAHSAHISRQTKTWPGARPKGRFTLVLTPKHAS